MSIRRVGVLAPMVLCLVMSACGSGLASEGPPSLKAQRSASANSGNNGNANGNNDGNADCAHFCNTLPPGPQRGQCKSDAAHGQGLCPECGGNVSRLCGLGQQTGPHSDTQPLCW